MLAALLIVAAVCVGGARGNIFARVWNGDYDDWNQPSAVFWVVIGCAAFVALLLLGLLIYWWCWWRRADEAASKKMEAEFNVAPYTGVMNKFSVPVSSSMRKML